MTVCGVGNIVKGLVHGLDCQAYAMLLLIRNINEFSANISVCDGPGLFYCFALDHLHGHHGGGYGAGTPQNLNFGVFNNIIVHFEKNLHGVSAMAGEFRHLIGIGKGSHIWLVNEIIYCRGGIA